MNLEDVYYNLLTRLDHPVFKKEFNSGKNPDDSYSSILNRCVAHALSILKGDVDDLSLDMFPHTVTAADIDNWEVDYFSFIKSNKEHETRRNELLDWINNEIGMSLPDVVTACEAIVGKTPRVIVNANKGNFILGDNAFGATTIFKGEDNTTNRYTYIVRFTSNITTAQAKRLDEELTKREKGGSKHIISYPRLKWVLGESALGIDTYLRI